MSNKRIYAVKVDTKMSNILGMRTQSYTFTCNKDTNTL